MGNFGGGVLPIQLQFEHFYFGNNFDRSKKVFAFPVLGVRIKTN